ncbi:histidyl-tRNA synthetase [Bradyrhizobium sp. USDA 4515]
MAEKPKKPQKLKARLPRGLEDRGPAAINATRAMVEKIRAVYELYGFEPVETPAMEYTDALGKFLPDQDRPNEGVFSFQDDDEQWISLRYDLTAPLARYVAENFDALPKPYRSYRFGYVFRNEKPGPGRFRQFMQFDADTVGSATPAADAEICMMAADTMEALGIPRGSYVVKVNNRKVLDGVLEAIGLGGEENAGRRLTVLRAIDKLDKFPADEVRKLLGPGRWDGGEEGKGDFTKGADLSPADADIVLAVTQQRDDWREAIAAAETYLAKSEVGQAGVSELEEIAKLVAASGYGADRIRIDPTVVRGLEYYTGPVYEVELLLDTKDEKGRPVRFGSVGGGGRYDGLVSRFRGEPVPATGFSIGGVAPAGGADDARRARHAGRVRPCRRHRVRPRSCRRLPEDGRAVAPGRHPRRALSRQSEEHGQPAQICRSPQLALRDHPGLGREGARRGADQGFDRRRQGRSCDRLQPRMA